ncbi:penicillin-binding protein 1C [Glacieibacterium frigidum]|uniref:peptidoglycan glycosyltransferase n=1 Tax=Glacieibacterium frigidum TaxID=2593303 RepID=A0A552UFB3_9SPHN|nr:penicillin-binding protein 1C [Glacieibacterium frigidum]TRW16912.1 penicillin-binding protein 1C [Glacieibacterium frigidum]
MKRWAIAAGLAVAVILAIVTWPPALPDYPQVRAAWVSSEARLLARDGRVLEVVRADPKVRRLDWVPLTRIAAPLVDAAIAQEDRRFRDHGGVDWRALAGSVRDRLRGRPLRGASTITMQLAGLLDPVLGRSGSRGPLQKLRQMRAAWALQRRWSKDQILEAWLNLLPWRGDLVGVDAAARGLAGVPPSALDAAQSRILAALIPAPAASPARVAARACRGEGDCTALLATADRMLGPRAALVQPHLAPHLAARLLGPATREVRTTVDADVQAFATEALTRRLAELSTRNVRDGAVIVVDNESGDILAYVGSAGAASTSPQVDGAAAPRQAGSTLKPFLYGLAIERRLLTAASVLDDSPVDLDTASGLYIPQNYDRTFRGPVSVRSALGNSLNVPAVRTLLLVGVDAFRERLFDTGYRGISREGDYYGFSLALGSAEVTLVEQAAAYRSLARGGRWSPLRLTPVTVTERAVLDPTAAAIVADILSDPAARTATFGTANGFALPFPAAVKTGTSKALRDNWCIGFTDRFTVAVWVGNFEGDAMGAGVSGVSGGAPVWREIMAWLHRDAPASGLPAPGTVRHRVTFVPAIEPPRSELFMPGTELDTVRVAPAAAERPRLLSPANGAVIALDPDIPRDRQRVAIRVGGAAPGMRLDIDGRALPLTGALWPPLPGAHRITLRARDGKPLDTALVTVR